MGETLTLTGMSPTVRVVVICSALILVLLASYPVLVWLNRRFRGTEQSASSRAFSIDDLEAMRASGHISSDEFRHLRSSALGLAAGGKAESESELSNSPGSDDEEAESSGQNNSDCKEDSE